jgi:pimeloyl-ACP methyl ester carboxylesterase
MPETVEERTYQSGDGLKLYYRSFGTKDPTRASVVCLPGLTRNSRDFAPLARHLARSRHVLTPDLRGRGRSQYDPVFANYHPGTYLTDVIALLDHEGIGRVAVIGTSLGGLIAMLLATARPRALAAIVLNDVGPEVAPEGLARISAYVGKLPPVNSWDDAVRQTRTVYGDALPDLSDAEWLEFTRAGFRDDGRGVPVPDMDPRIGETVRAAPQGAAPDLWPVFAALQPVPTLAIRGARSDVLSAQTLVRMQSEKPDLHVLTVANRGHAPRLDEPECVAAIDALLAALPHD